MSQPPPYTQGPINPDTRPLPPGWIQRFDCNYQTWFYVNTQVQPPVSSWIHPLGPRSPPPPQSYPALDGPLSNNYHGGPFLQGPQYTGYNQSPQPNFAPYGGNLSPYPGQVQPTWQPQQQYSPSGSNQKSGLLGGMIWPHQSQPPNGYGYGPAPQVIHQQQSKKSGMGGGTMLAAVGGAGLLGGLLVADAIDDLTDNDYDDGGDFL